MFYLLIRPRRLKKEEWRVILGFRIISARSLEGKWRGFLFGGIHLLPSLMNEPPPNGQAAKTKEMAGRKGAARSKESAGPGYNGEMKSIQTVVELSTHNCMLAREDFWFPLQLL